MQEQVIRRLHEVFGYGLELKERLESGATMQVASEHDRLRTLILADRDLDNNPAYNIDFHHGRRAGDDPFDKSPYFFGGRYALVCWLDELLPSQPTPRWFADQWETMTMEQTLHGGTQERAWRFWDQARKALQQAHPEALCAYFWAVMLGFRGEPEKADPPVDVSEWVMNTKSRLLKISGAAFPLPAEQEVPTWVPPLRGREQFTRMMRIGVVVLGAIAFLVTLVISKQIGSYTP